MDSHTAYGDSWASIHCCTALMWSMIQKGHFPQGAPFLQQLSFSLSHNFSLHQHCISQTSIMDNQSRDYPASYTGIPTQDQQQSPPPTVPSTPPSVEAPATGQTPVSKLESRVYLSSWLPPTAPEDKNTNLHQGPLCYGDRVRVVKTPFGDIARIIPDNTNSDATQRFQLHPNGTQYSVEEDTRSNKARTLVGLEEQHQDGLLDGTKIGLHENSWVEVGLDVFKPLLVPPSGHSYNPSQQSLEGSDDTSKIPDILDEVRDMYTEACKVKSRR
jgi:hypothetical protein